MKSALNKEITIGIVAPSFFIEKKDSYSRGIKCLADCGFKLKFGEMVNKRYYNTTGTSVQRANEINSMFADSEVNLIMATDGGCRAIDILEYLDYDLIKQHPKPICGFSDITHLLLAIYALTGNCSIHGIDIVNGFGQTQSKSKEQNIKEFIALVNTSKWNQIKLKSARVLKHGQATGIAVGGWLNAIHNLANTTYFPQKNDIILFWEAIEEEPNRISMMLHSLRLSGLFNHVSGMVVGKLSDCIEKEYFDCIPTIDDIILEACVDYQFPIIVDAPFGHGAEKIPFKYGTKIIIDTEKLL